MRPRVRRATDVALGLAVAVALLQTARLWSSPLLTRAEGRPPAAYLAPGAAARADASALVQPLRLMTGEGGRRFRVLRPGAGVAPALWTALAAAGAAVPGAALRRAGLEPLAELRQRPGWAYAEAVLPFPAPLDTWRRLLALIAGAGDPPGAAAPPGEDPPLVDRLLLLAGPGRRLVAWEFDTGALVFDAGGAAGAGPVEAGVAEAVRRAAAAERQLARALAAGPPEGGEPAQPLPDRIGNLRVDRGVRVPAASPRLAIAQAVPLAVEADRYAEAFFRDLALVWKRAGPRVTVYSDGRATLSLDRRGDSEYRRSGPPEADAAGAPDPAEGLRRVAAFVRDRGGWPPQWVLADLRALRVHDLVAPRTYGYRYGFVPLLEGLPVADGPWLMAEWGGPGREVFALRRRFAELAVLPDVRWPAVPALAVLQQVAALPADVVPLQLRRVRDVGLAYRLEGRGLGIPVWVVTLADGSRLLYEAVATGPVPRWLGRVEGPFGRR